jgi:hypothetical protein
MENCKGFYTYNKETVECPLKWKCENYSLRGGDKRKVSKPVLVELKDHVFTPSCYVNVFDKS